MTDQTTSTTGEEPLRVVLLAIDGSKHCQRAFDYYVKQLRRHNDVLLLVHAIEPPSVPGSLSVSNSGDAFLRKHAEMLEEQIAEARRMESRWKDSCRELGMNHFSFLLVSGEPGEAICRAAEEHSADMVVMGSRGLGLLRRTFIGSVSDYVLHHAYRPVMICPPTKREATE
ncbi:hypothetical protein BOX15_Mlig010515g1 [Macrostomum lignano]|uniref:UspA domain-containing protein n=1 Tax=Macrostomum lignano TaxID=282301 RepID=A0A267FZA7_9PLAT|nr:hypothetical protein BOX15_Mlig018764g1 [Macrostomum lignano]PAA79160.1 hypothetical protein BOX15_Mlig010515g1 [Macrostomum lignano]